MHYRIFQAYNHQSVFDSASAWLAAHFTEDQAGWDYTRGRSWINGGVYPAAVYFKHPEDYLAFKLQFSELCL